MSAADPWEKAPERFLLAPIYKEVAAAIGWRKAVELGQWVYENKQAPCRKARRNHDGRGSLYVSRRASTKVAREIAAVIGEDATRVMQAEFGGEILQFGSIEPASIPRRNRAIVEQLDACGRAALVACAFDLTERVIRRIYLVETGKAFKESATRKSERIERMKEKKNAR